MAKATKGQVEEILAELGKKIDVLIDETKDARDDVREEVEKKIQELKKRKQKLENDFNSYKENNQGKWEEARNHFLTALHELRLAVESIFKDKPA